MVGFNVEIDRPEKNQISRNIVTDVPLDPVENVKTTLLPIINKVLMAADQAGAITFFIDSIKEEILEEEEIRKQEGTNVAAIPPKASELDDDDDTFQEDSQADSFDDIPSQRKMQRHPSITERSLGAHVGIDPNIPTQPYRENPAQRIVRLGRPFNPLRHLAEQLKNSKGSRKVEFMKGRFDTDE